jgi:CRP-like cAMP-binding protein
VLAHRSDPNASCAVQNILELCGGLEQEHFAPGEPLLVRGTTSGKLFILASGRLEVCHGDTVITAITEPGSILGELSVLLNVPHQADVRALTAATCYVTTGGRGFLSSRPEITLFLAELLARRLKAMLGYLGDLKAQYEDRADHLGMVDEILLNLAHRVPKERAPVAFEEP